MVKTLFPEEYEKSCSDGVSFGTWTDFWHTVPNWDYILKLGFSGILEKAETSKEELLQSGQAKDSQIHFLDSVIICYRAILRLLQRIYEYSLSFDAAMFSECIQNLMYRPPQTLYEVMQFSVLFLYVEELGCERARTLGDIDRLYLPYYQSDIDRGVPAEELDELFRFFFLHFTSAQLWVDSCYMAPPFLAVMGYVEEAVRQLRGMFRYLQCKETKVLFHNYDVGSGKFVRRLRWATGNGWALMGIARVAIEAKKRGMMDYYNELTAMGNELLDAMLQYQQPDGRFLDIMDDENSFVEGTAAMMMSVYIYRGVLEGWLGKEYLMHAEKAFAAVTADIDRFGILRHVCGCPHFVEEGTSCEAQASYVMAAAWRERAMTL